MLINGEKYACEACVRGHRVSTCQHHDRQLTHINKKGRPVSQCPHCRGLRKARAAHVACECGSKPHTKDDCGENETKSDYGESHSDTTSDPGTTEQRSCCCSHGVRCTCALKKDHYLDTVPEVDPPLLSRKRASSGGKPRLLKAGSDNALTVFTNGHHKPVHKHNDAAHKCGVPYKIPIPHSVHGNADVARRSTDSLPIMRTKAESHAQLQETFNSARQVPRMARSEHGSPEPRATFFSQEKVGAVPPLDLSYPTISNSVPAHFSNGYRQSPQPQEVYYEPQEEPPLLSGDLTGAPVEWSDLNLPLGNSAYSTGFTQPPTYISLDNIGSGAQCYPTSSSGEGSDTASDYISYSANHGSPFRPELTATSSADARSINRLSSSSFTSNPQASSLSPSNQANADPEFHPKSASPIDFQDPNNLPAEFHPTSASPSDFQDPNNMRPEFRPTSASPSDFQDPNNIRQEFRPTSASPTDYREQLKLHAELHPTSASPIDFKEPHQLRAEFHPTSASPTDFQEPHNLHADAFERHGLTVHDVQKMAHPETPTAAMNSLSLPVQNDEVTQHLWGNRLDPPMDTFVSQDMVEGVGVGNPSWQ